MKFFPPNRLYRLPWKRWRAKDLKWEGLLKSLHTSSTPPPPTPLSPPPSPHPTPPPPPPTPPPTSTVSLKNSIRQSESTGSKCCTSTTPRMNGEHTKTAMKISASDISVLMH